VLELPYPWCAASAEFFASAGVSLISRLGIFDRICFGSESGDAGMLRSAVRNLCDPAFEAKIAAEVRNSVDESYIRLRNRLYKETYGEEMTSLPNDILGVEYIKALEKSASAVEPYIIRRTGGFSATESRRRIRSSDMESLDELLPGPMLETVLRKKHSDIENAASAVLYRLRSADASELEQYADIPKGMGRRLCDAAYNSISVAGLYENAAQKLYTDARIRRMVLYSMTDVRLTDLRNTPSYTTVLAFNSKGAGLLSDIKAYRKSQPDDAGIPEVITKPSQASKLSGIAARQYELSRKAELLYGLCFDPIHISGDDLRRGPYISKKEDE